MKMLMKIVMAVVVVVKVIDGHSGGSDDGDDDSDHSGNNDGYFLSWGRLSRDMCLERDLPSGRTYLGELLWRSQTD